MKIDHNMTNAHNGHGASKMNVTVDPMGFRSGAEYLAAALGLADPRITAHPATYGVR